MHLVIITLIAFVFVISYLETASLQISTAITGVVDLDAEDSVHSEDQPELKVQQSDVDALPSSCYECSVKFESMRELTAHLMMHAVLKPFSCGRCLQPFAEADETKQHFHYSCSLLAS